MFKLRQPTRLTISQLLASPIKFYFADENAQLKLPSGTSYQKSDKPFKNNDLFQESLTPKKVVEYLDKFVIGQSEAKKAVAISFRNRWRRKNLSEELRNEITPKNLLIQGPTGSGKS